jgi:predicted secreted hydrolase
MRAFRWPIAPGCSLWALFPLCSPRFWLWFSLCLCASVVRSSSTADFRSVVPGYHFQFPRDHFDHPDFRAEWWYYTGNLHAQDGHRYGFELVFFRQGQRSPQTRAAGDNPSTWRVDDLYLAHLALTDIDGKGFRYNTRLNRAGPGIAGINFDERRIWNGNWQARWETASGAQRLIAVAEDLRFNIRLTPRKAPVINGENGVSQKAEGTGFASYYVSFPRLAVDGTVNGTAVSGLAWMDHEWFTNQLAPNQAGWDWFSIQLDNGTDLMLFQLRRTDGMIDPYSAGTFIDRDGHASHLKRADFDLQPIEFWRSPKTGARYPVRWRISVPSRKLTLDCAATVPQQELAAPEQQGTTYWEGAVIYSGSASGAGYLEMTGYDKPVRF